MQYWSMHRRAAHLLPYSAFAFSYISTIPAHLPKSRERPCITITLKIGLFCVKNSSTVMLFCVLFHNKNTHFTPDTQTLNAKLSYKLARLSTWATRFCPALMSTTETTGFGRAAAPCINALASISSPATLLAVSVAWIGTPPPI